MIASHRTNLIQLEDRHAAALSKWSIAWWLHIAALAAAILLTVSLVAQRVIEDARQYELQARV